jgi:hypothetical protein
MEQNVIKQVKLLKSASVKVRAEAQKNLQKHGRFYEPILKSILQNETDMIIRGQIQRLLETN